MLVHESSVGLSSTTNPSLGVAIPVPAQAHLYILMQKAEHIISLCTFGRILVIVIGVQPHVMFMITFSLGWEGRGKSICHPKAFIEG